MIKKVEVFLMLYWENDMKNIKYILENCYEYKFFDIKVPIKE